MSKLKIKKGDTVVVIAGKDKGKTAKVTLAQPENKKVVVEGVNMLTHFNKARSAQDQNAGIKKAEGPIDVSNVMIICSSCKKATRVGYKIEGEDKIRFCKKCGASLDAKISKKKAEPKKAKVAKEPAKEAVKETEVASEVEKPKKPRAKKTVESK